MRTFGLIALLCCTAALPAWSQEFDREVAAEGVPYYTFAELGEATVQVTVLGSNAGIYEVGAETRIDQLLALAGGAGFGSPTARTTIRVYRPEGGGRILLYEASAQDVLTNPSEYPLLRDGDLLVVETFEPQRFSWQSAFSIISGATSLILLGVQLLGN
jgi:hypothetical protein